MTDQPNHSDILGPVSLPPAEDAPVISVIRQLVDLLAEDALTVEDVVAFVGPLENDPGTPLPIELCPNLFGVRAAELACYPDSGQPYALMIELCPDVRVAPSMLRAVLGDYRRARTPRGMPMELVFLPRSRGTLWRVVVMAQLEPGAGMDDGSIASIALRRDATSD